MSSRKLSVKCAECGKEEMAFPSRAVKYTTCSKACMGIRFARIGKDTKVTVDCAICAKPFLVKRSQAQRRVTCTKTCFSRLQRRKCLNERNFNYQGKGSYPSRRIPRDGKSRSNLKYLHKIVMTDIFGFHNVPEGHHIHHRDGDCRNNHPENLVLLTTSDHKWLLE